MLRVHQELCVLGCARDASRDCLKYVCIILKTNKEHLLGVAQVLTSVPAMRSAELHGFLGLHLRTAYGIWGWTLYPLLTQAHNYSPTQNQQYNLVQSTFIPKDRVTCALKKTD